MKRKDFFKTAAGTYLACAGSAILAGQEAAPAPDKDERERRAREHEERFKRAYILTLMENLEKCVDEPTRVRMMNDCGRACARRGGLFKAAEDCRGDLKTFVARMAGGLGAENARFLDEGTVHWSYPRCFCELVASGPDRLPAVYCPCSVGWVMEMFEAVLQRPVRVRLIQSVKSGASSCVFRVDAA
ncbi:MAG: hypothetical protein A2Y56_15465 [Candidatus Aminicenantes bacterium RBG_13_63_10]|nr:MAG: hypothetical protein A2Y56_15465 [Candidatus Aminicenantes bacterium RBG_13_63_10]